MDTQGKSSDRLRIGPFILIAAVVAGIAFAFLYVGGWLTPDRLTPDRIVASLSPASGPALGRRRNHVKGICFTGVFDANGEGEALSTAPMLVRGEYPVIGRFNLASADIAAPDASVRVRGLSLDITAPGGEVWRTAMIDAPFFPVATPQAFYDLQLALKSKAPTAMPAFITAHPEFGVFAAWAHNATWTGSYAEDRYNSLDSFVFTNKDGVNIIVRWSFVPSATVAVVPANDLAKQSPDFLEQDITQRVAQGPLRWTMQVIVAGSGDLTADPSKAWPESRRTVNVGTLIVRAVEPEANGSCRDINYDPAVLPSGMTVSDDPFPAARSAAYRRSYDLRTAEDQFYPRDSSRSTQ